MKKIKVRDLFGDPININGNFIDKEVLPTGTPEERIKALRERTNALPSNITGKPMIFETSYNLEGQYILGLEEPKMPQYREFPKDYVHKGKNISKVLQPHGEFSPFRVP